MALPASRCRRTAQDDQVPSLAATAYIAAVSTDRLPTCAVAPVRTAVPSNPARRRLDSAVDDMALTALSSPTDVVRASERCNPHQAIDFPSVHRRLEARLDRAFLPARKTAGEDWTPRLCSSRHATRLGVRGRKPSRLLGGVASGIMGVVGSEAKEPLESCRHKTTSSLLEFRTAEEMTRSKGRVFVPSAAEMLALAIF
ncbi:hypothetical protein CSOJ01_04541 [Colletotrichum sojae]|uniref:Uncharacterized protein n=1 Tax=Colletotrichum sojae TaxID=2175907 RepID=A0A8H6JHW9_9PEZI|nr:hypothetical protein CSOJ01_04541 [Colletotrichum sojae]